MTFADDNVVAVVPVGEVPDPDAVHGYDVR